ncbi:MAG: hypothetical protein LBN00_03655 [Oscillospiraceae bacterium]|jgi:hypothetical protein|nr:hypothetical protein [Oscillospiraceae bacterium]
MTDEEAALWTARTESSRYRWTEDEIVSLSKRGAMYYLGGVDGFYMRIEKDGLLTVGDYEGAIPHIGEAFFTIRATKQYKNFDAAFTAVLELGGKKFLVDMFSGDPLVGYSEQPSVHKQIEASRSAPPVPRKTKSENKEDIGR